VSAWLRASLPQALGIVFFGIGAARARGLNIECGCFGTIGGKHIGLANLAIDSTLFILAALLAGQSMDCPAKKIFREAGAQNAAPPLRGFTEGQSGNRARVTSYRVW